MKRFFILSFACLAACSSAPTAPREPASLPVDPTISATFHDTVAVTALVLGAPDARGERQPLCHIDLIDRPDLALGYLTTPTTRQTFKLNLPVCSAEQQNEIFQVASQASRPVFAGPGQLMYRCGLNFTVAATLMTVYTTAYGAVAKDAAMRKVSPAAGTKAAIITSSAREYLKKGPELGPRTAAAFVCTGVGALAGQAIGYLLAPR